MSYITKLEKHFDKFSLLLAVLGACIIVILGDFFIFWRCKQLKRHKVERDTSDDIEDDTSSFGVPFFSYKELEEATHNFDPAKELGMEVLGPSTMVQSLESPQLITRLSTNF